MANFLDPFRGNASGETKKNLSVRAVGPIAQPNLRKPQPAPSPSQLNRAAAIYGAAASVFGVLTIYMFTQGMWVTGLIMVVTTAALAGYSWYFFRS